LTFTTAGRPRPGGSERFVPGTRLEIYDLDQNEKNRQKHH